jgi:hypothetical protein
MHDDEDAITSPYSDQWLIDWNLSDFTQRNMANALTSFSDY